MYKIGVQYTQYPEERNILNKVDNATYFKVSEDVNVIRKIIDAIKRTFKIKKIKREKSVKEIFSFRHKYHNEIDFYHLFNSISYGENNWGVTFETVVPFHEEDKIGCLLRCENFFFENRGSIEKLSD